MLKRLALVLPLLWCAEASARGATLPAGFTEVSYGGISGGTAMAVAPDGRIFVCEQGGKLRVIKNGAFLATPFLTLTVDSNGERGLLGIAFDPNFVTNQYVYVYYTVPTAPIHNRLSRFTANGDVAVAGSEFVLLNLDNLTATNHNGGALHFGLDGKLYVAVGENAVASNAQTLTNLLGKILRLNSDGSIPADNPFNGNPNARHEIWTYGHRNPFSFGVQPFTGRIFVNDVGQVTTEEIDDEMAGLNYGWPTCEGPFLQGSTTTPCNNPAYTDPFSYYLHTGSPTPCAITGGDFYNPQTPQFPSNYVGNYFFADYCGDFIRRIDPDTQVVTTFATGMDAPVDIDVDDYGNLYYLARGAGAVYKVTYTGSSAPVITQNPASQLISSGHPVTFSVAASGAAPLAYQWQKNDADISGANSTDYTIASVGVGDDGDQYRCIVSNAFPPSATSAEATLTVTTNQPPTATISRASRGHDLQGRRHDQLLGLGHAIRRRARCLQARSPGG